MEHIAWCNIPCNAIPNSFFLTLRDKFRDKLLSVTAPLTSETNNYNRRLAGIEPAVKIFPILNFHGQHALFLSIDVRDFKICDGSMRRSEFQLKNERQAICLP
jgi:hypothetical protein